MEKIREDIGDETGESRAARSSTRELFERVALADEFPEFLTLPAYDELTD